MLRGSASPLAFLCCVAVLVLLLLCVGGGHFAFVGCVAVLVLLLLWRWLAFCP